MSPSSRINIMKFKMIVQIWKRALGSLWVCIFPRIVWSLIYKNLIWLSPKGVTERNRKGQLHRVSPAKISALSIMLMWNFKMQPITYWCIRTKGASGVHLCSHRRSGSRRAQVHSYPSWLWADVLDIWMQCWGVHIRLALDWTEVSKIYLQHMHVSPPKLEAKNHLRVLFLQSFQRTILEVEMSHFHGSNPPTSPSIW